jgi:protein-S-isoprenylcysteine O-methyltransferase Ste14
MLKALSIIGYLEMLGGVIAQFATKNLLSTSPLVIGVQVGAVLLMFWARLAFGRRSFHLAANPTAGGLVTSGPYRYIRHPIYAAFSLFSWAGVVAHWSLVSALLGGLAVGGALLRILCEEVMVTARYPEYRQYSATTWRMIPYVF